jgi:hypothetical protein
MSSVEELVQECRNAKLAYEIQERKLRIPHYNGRYLAKTERLWLAWKKLETQLLKAVYK